MRVAIGGPAQSGSPDALLRRGPLRWVMVLAHRSWVDETGVASPADVDGSWYGLSPTLRLTLDLAPVGTPGCCL
jgi:hypothetical protein